MKQKNFIQIENVNKKVYVADHSLEKAVNYFTENYTQPSRKAVMKRYIKPKEKDKVELGNVKLTHGLVII